MIILILIIGLVLRFISLNQSLWFDEAGNTIYAQRTSLEYYLTKYLLGDFHPPLWFAILWFWTHLVGGSVFVIRLLPVFLGVITIFLTFLIGKSYSKNVGLIAALLLAMSPLHIYYSQEARPYALAAMSVTLCFYFLIRLIDKKKYALIGYAFSVSLVLYSSYVAYFIFPAQFLYLIFFQRTILKRYFLAFLLSLIMFIPWLFVLPEQLTQGQNLASKVSGWKDIVGGAGLKEGFLLWVKIIFGRVSLENNWIYLTLLIILSTPYLTTLYKSFKNFSETKLFWFWFLIPALLAWAFSFLIPVFSYFRVLFVLPAFYLLLSLGIDKLSKKIKSILLSIILMMQLLLSLTYLLNSDFHREDWVNAVKFTRDNLTTDSQIIFEHNEIPSPFIYYGGDIKNVQSGLIKIPAQDKNDLAKLELKEKIYLYEYLVDITDPNRVLEKELVNLGYKQTEIFNFRGVGFIKLYKRKN